MLGGETTNGVRATAACNRDRTEARSSTRTTARAKSDAVAVASEFDRVEAIDVPMQHHGNLHGQPLHRRPGKRVLDIVGAVLALVSFAPLFLLTTVAGSRSRSWSDPVSTDPCGCRWPDVRDPQVPLDGGRRRGTAGN